MIGLPTAQYGRLLRYVEFGGDDLGRKQVRKRWARVDVFDRPFKRLGPYDRAEDRARAAKTRRLGQVRRLLGGRTRSGSAAAAMRYCAGEQPG